MTRGGDRLTQSQAEHDNHHLSLSLFLRGDLPLVPVLCGAAELHFKVALPLSPSVHTRTEPANHARRPDSFPETRQKAGPPQAVVPSSRFEWCVTSGQKHPDSTERLMS